MRKFYLKQLLLAAAFLFTVNVYAQCPTITMGANPSVCSGTSMVQFNYTATTGGPDQFRINWDALPDVPYTFYPLAPVGGVINVFFLPPFPAVGTHTGTLYVRSGAGCESVAYPISVTYKEPVITSVTGPNVCQGTSSTTLSFTASGSPNQYSIDWLPASNDAGFLDVPLSTWSGGSVPILNVPSVAGIYYGNLYVKSATTACTSPPVQFAVVVGSNITLGANPSICTGTSTAPLTYSAVTLGANQYRIEWDPASFSDVAWTTLPASPITLTGIPSISGTHTGTLYVRNSSSGCESPGKPISVTVGPGITLGANPIACTGALVSIGYTATFGSPNQYRIDWDGTAITDIPLSTFTGPSFLNVGTISAGPGLYTGTLFVKNSATGCESSGYPINMTINNRPTITPGPNPNICSGVATALLTYTATTGSPTEYFINWEPPASLQMSNIPPTALPASPITISGIPTALPGGIFLGKLFVKNSGIGCVSNENPITITKLVTSIGLGPSPTVCSGVTSSSVTYSSTFGSPNQYRIDWVSGITDVGPTSLPPSPIPINGIPTTPGLYTGTLYVKNTTNGCESGTAVSVTVNGITGGTVAASQTICLGGDPAAFTQSVAATGSGALTINWQSSADNITFTDIVGATAATYDVPVGLLTTTYYRRKATSLLNSISCTAFSNTLTVTVNGVITGGVVAGNQTICVGGDPVAFTEVTPSTGGGTLTYQWVTSLDNITFVNVPGATGIIYDPTVAMSGINRYYKRITYSTQNGYTCSTNSNTLFVSLNSVTSGAIAGPQTICSGGDPVAFTQTTAATGTGTLTYQWQSSPDLTNFTNIADATNTTYDIPAGLLQYRLYRRAAISTLNGVPCTVTSTNLSVAINQVTSGTVAGDRVVCSAGNPAAFTQTVASTGSGTLTYQWQVSNDNSVFTDIGGATATTYDVAAGQLSNTYYKRITKSTIGSLVCSAVGNALTVTVNTPVTGGEVTSSQVICNWGDPAPFTETVASTGPNLSYQWQRSVDPVNFANLAGATAVGYDVPTSQTQSYFYKRITTATQNGLGCTAGSNSLYVRVNYTTSTISGGGTSCYGGSSQVSIALTGTAPWNLTYSDGTTSTPVSGIMSSPYTFNVSIPPGVKNYTVTAMNDAFCSAAFRTGTAQVRVNQQVTGGTIQASQTICYGGDPVPFSPVTPATGYLTLTYMWQKSTDNVTFSNIGSTNGPYHDAPALTQTTYYRRQVSATENFLTCTALSNTLTALISPGPTDGIITASATSICLGQSVTISSSGSGDTPYYWASTDGMASWNVFAQAYGGQSSFSYTPTQPGTYTFHVRNANSCGFCWQTGGCTDGSVINVIVRPRPVAAITSPSAAVCIGENTSFSVGGTVSASGSWVLTLSNGGGTVTGTGSTWSKTVSPGTTTTYTIVSLFDDYCTATAADRTGSATMTIKPLPSMSAYASIESICPGSSTPLWAYGANSYSWSPTTGLSATTGSPVIASPTVPTTYTVTGTTNGCSGSTQVTVSIKPPPTAGTIYASSSSICLGSSVTISSYGSSDAPYYWASSNGVASWNVFSGAYGGQYSFMFTPTYAGTYRFYVYNRNACGFCWETGSCGADSFVDVTVSEPQPYGYISQYGTLCDDLYVTLEAGGGYNYVWYRDGGLLQYENNSQLTVWVGGQYSVGYTTFDGNCYTATIYVSQGSGDPNGPIGFCVSQGRRRQEGSTNGTNEETLEEQSMLGIYPNPANTDVTVEVPVKAETTLDVMMVSQLGHTVLGSSIQKGEVRTTLDTRNLTEGVYIVLIKSPKGTMLTQKVFVKH